MSGTVIGTSLQLGFAGKVSRNPDNIIGARAVKSIITSGSETLASIPFGSAVVLNTDNTYSKFGDSGSGVSNPTAALFAGIAVAEVKQMTTYGNVSAAGAYAPAEMCDVLQRGSTTVPCTEGTPTAGGKVYICTVVGSTAAVGDFIATASPAAGTAVELPNCRWTTGKQDAVTLLTEITILNRVNP